MLRTLLCALFVAASLCGTVHADTPLFSADGYRLTLYRSPTPTQIDGAQIVDTPAVQALLQQTPTPLLVDVYRRPWLHGQFVEDQPHANLPNSLWLANAGDGELTPEWQTYFARNLRTGTAERLDHPVVFYCRSDCWLSWNAIKRARALGYTRLYWYRDGLDAWEAAGLPVTPAQPQPLP